MINSINQTTVNHHWKKLSASTNSGSSMNTSNALTDQSTQTTDSKRDNKVISVESLIAMMQRAQRLEFTTAASSTSDAVAAATDTTASDTTADEATTDGITAAGSIKPPMGPPPQDSDTEVTFSSDVDTDGDGTISKAEYEAAMTGESDVLSTDEFFTQVDTNSDGKISSDEFSTAYKAERHPMGRPPMDFQAIPSDIDADSDGSVSTDEYETLVSQMGASDALSAEDFFKEYDTDSNGEITAQEIIAGLESAIKSATADDTTTNSSTTDSASNGTTTGDSETVDSSSSTAASENIAAQSLSAQYLSTIEKMVNAYEKNYEYMFDKESTDTGSIA